MSCLADIDTKRITGISDSEVVIPVRWGANATDLRWNNAIALGVTIARSIDRMNLWDGYLHFKESVPAFNLSFGLFKTSEISDELNLNTQSGISLPFAEVIPYHSIEFTFKTSDISAAFPVNYVVKAYAESDTIIYVEMYNPVYSSNLSANTGAFSITATFGGVMYTVYPSSVEIIGYNLIKLTLDSFEQASGEISVLYKKELGNIKKHEDGDYLDSFNVAFTYTTTYTEGE